MALTSSTGIVASNTVTFAVTPQGSSRGNGIVLYIDYTLGGADLTIELQISYNDSNIDSNYYDRVSNTAGALALEPLTFAATGKLKTKADNSLNDDNIKITVTGLVNGDLNIEFGIDNGFR